MDNPMLPKQEGEKLIESPEAQKLREELEKCQKKADEYLTGWKRAKADFVNREKEIERQRSDFIAFATKAVLRDLLPPYEAFVKACSATPQDVLGTPWGKGMVQVRKNFDDFMKKSGVTRMEVLGKKFNPMEHEVVAKRKEEGKESESIVEVVKEGYLLYGKPFVTPKVIIAE